MDKEKKAHVLEIVVAEILAGVKEIGLITEGHKGLRDRVAAIAKAIKAGVAWADMVNAVHKSPEYEALTKRDAKRFADRLAYLKSLVGVPARPKKKSAAKRAKSEPEGGTVSGELPEPESGLTAPAERVQYAKRLLAFFAEACGVEIEEGRKIMLAALTK